MDDNVSDKLWATYHHIAKLRELGGDEKGNQWVQETYGEPAGFPHGLDPDQLRQALRLRPAGELCGTMMCFAGWYAYLSGVKMNQKGQVMKDGKTMPVSEFVRAEVALAPNLGGTLSGLFSSCNDLDDIRAELIYLTGQDRS